MLLDFFFPSLKLHHTYVIKWHKICTIPINLNVWVSSIKAFPVLQLSPTSQKPPFLSYSNIDIIVVIMRRKTCWWKNFSWSTNVFHEDTIEFIMRREENLLLNFITFFLLNDSFLYWFLPIILYPVSSLIYIKSFFTFQLVNIEIQYLVCAT